VNRIEVRERRIPSEPEILARTRERLMVKVEQEMRAIPEAERAFTIDRLVPIVEEMAASRETLRDLAAVLAAYLREHRPERTVPADAEPSRAPRHPDDERAAARPEPRQGGGGRRRNRRGGRRR
jgi:hypothetical protein